MPTFTPDTATVLPPSGNYMSHKKPLNRRTNSGWLVAKTPGVCACGKTFIAGNEIALCHGKISGCYWCCREVKPTVGDVAAFRAWGCAVIAAGSPAANTVRMYLANVPTTYREMVAVVSFAQGLK